MPGSAVQVVWCKRDVHIQDHRPLQRALGQRLHSHSRFTQKLESRPGIEFHNCCLPELAAVPGAFVRETWTMPVETQRPPGVRMGKELDL